MVHVSTITPKISDNQPDRLIERFPAGSPRGSWPAEEFAAARRAEGTPAIVVMDLASDSFLVVKAGV
jgi:hypothetical protein